METSVRRAIRLLVGFVASNLFLVLPLLSPLQANDDLNFQVVEYATVPSRQNGQKARINSLTYTGDRLFVVTSLDGLIYEITGGNTALWFDVRAAHQGDFNTESTIEGGLRSLAFHPDFDNNGLFYTSETVDRPSAAANVEYLSDAAVPQSFDSVVSEWQVVSGNSINGPREVLRIGSPGPHIIKQIAFNPHAEATDPDYGLLYLSHGDGGHWQAPLGGHQNNALGKILRIDPLQTQHSSYSIPQSNPFDGAVFPAEAYAVGFRSPHNLAFTRAGELLVAEIGNRNVEEINLVVNGGDYGWNEREGTFEYLSANAGTGINPLPAEDALFGYRYPVAQLIHDPNYTDGFAIAGGYPIENLSELHGTYIYAEFATQGHIYYSMLDDLRTAVTTGPPADLTQAATFNFNVQFDHDANTQTQHLAKNSMLDVINDSALYAQGSRRADIRFGQGPLGELYVTSKQNNTVYRVENSLPPGYVDTATADQPIEIVSPESHLVLPANSVSFNWQGTGVSEWWLYVGTASGASDIYDSGNLGTATSATVNQLPTNGSTVHARLWYRQPGDSTWKYIDETYTSASVQQSQDINPAISSPVAGTRIEGEFLPLNYSGQYVTSWWIYAGSAPGSNDYYDSGAIDTHSESGTHSIPLPVHVPGGSQIHIRLWYQRASNQWDFIDSNYIIDAAPRSNPVSLVSPLANEQLPGPQAQFVWSGDNVSEWWIYVGSDVGLSDYVDSGSLGTDFGYTAGGLPVDGSSVFLRLWYRLNGNSWNHIDYEFVAADLNLTTEVVAGNPSIINPLPGSQLTSSSLELIYQGNNILEWWVYAGSSRGMRDYLDSGSLGLETSLSVELPSASGPTIHIRLWYRVPNGEWNYIDEEFLAEMP